jgi:amidase
MRLKSLCQTSIVWLLFIFTSFSFTFASEKKFTNEELCYLSVAKLLQLYQSGELSPVDVLQAQIARIESLNPNINAIAEKHYAEALQQAKESEKRYKSGTQRPLEGITCAVKDDVFVKGWKSTKGSLIMKDTLPCAEDTEFASVLRDTGVVMHIHTNVPEYYCNLVTWNKLFGVCRNPWNTSYTPGGSSGGSAASLVAGFATLATGSDMGGSIRVPAAMTSLYGYKPPYGRVATSLLQYESYGPLARSFDDLVLFQNAISGPCEAMISTLKPKLIYPTSYGDLKGWKIVYDPMDNWGIPVDSTVKEAMKNAVALLRELGVDVVEMDLGFRAKDFDIYALGIFSTSMGAYTFKLTEKHPELITPYIAYFIERYSKRVSPYAILEAEDYIFCHHKEIQKRVFSQGFKAIIMPTLCTPYITAEMGSTVENTIVTINGKPYSGATWDYAFTWPWNMLGHYPVLNVPVGHTPENIPMGMQIISNTYEDLDAFQVAYQWSKAKT